MSIPKMRLPPGKVCGDCAHWKRCAALIQTLTGKETTCDFAPSLFRDASKEQKP